MTMADKKDDKNNKVDEGHMDDIFDDVLGERKEAKATESEETEEVSAPKKHPTHSRLDPRPATTASAKADLNDIWLTNREGKLFPIDEMSPEDFAWWCNDKLPGMRKIEASAVNTSRHRRDIFEEVISILEHWFAISQSRNRNLF